MRKIAILAAIGLVAIVVACSRHSGPPVGRWIGTYETADIMVDCRLEILRNGTVRISAPNILGVGAGSDAERTAQHARLAADLDKGWAGVTPRPMDFDGRVFRKPGGVAPQMEWNPGTGAMKLIFYFGRQKSVRIVMQKVTDFSADPWRS
jgi:hypothetical protein